MNALKSIFAVLILIVSMPAHASEENSLRIENITSISSIVNPATLDLAKSVKAAPERRNFIQPQAFWSPDGSKLLVRSSIGWRKGDINFRPSNRNGIAAIYSLDADGTNLTKIVSNEINNRSTPVGLPIPPDYIPWSPSGDKIVTDVNRPRMGSFYVLSNPDGTGLNALGTNFSDIISIITNLSKISMQKDFIWSPDGTKAAFVVNDPDKLYITDADGSNIKQLAGEVNESFFGALAWSHNGKKIAFSGRNLWIMNSDGTNIRQLGACWGGTWSPDDLKLLCTSSEEVDDQYIRHLYLLNAESADKTEIIKSIEIENPQWSSDGSSILFVSFTERRNPGIYVADSQGGNVKLIYEDNNQLEAVSWSPEGSKIAFTSLENGAKLYTINPDGTGETLLTSNLSWNWDNPYAWSPSGDKIAFSSSITNGEHIFIANPDGTELVQITTGENKPYRLSGMGGSWSPDGSRLLIESSNEVIIAKLSGYDRSIAIKQSYRTENESFQELPEQTMPEPNLTAAPQISTPAGATPKAQGFDVVLAIGIIYTINLFKRRYN
jgi:Tol biopolymer transport system component